MTGLQNYRDEALHEVEVWDWDVVLMHGTVRVVGMSHEHLKNCAKQYGGGCRCGENARISSPVVCPQTRQVLKESWWEDQMTTGSARHLLEAKEGTVIPVSSGKVYRLVGPRKVEGHDNLAYGSIWRVYTRAVVPKPETWWSRVQRFLGVQA